ncbi:transcription elongation factor SPT6 [Caerostris extrusa]|uniref:Transcription elongation factor SPT6 n=1 Tax=Caerostris extrusa TaxID=172846 RepID=A0AAV4WLZ5_CAEEX|nr:transcription elongation factor SPT6 [Caerostris extrusa]
MQEYQCDIVMSDPDKPITEGMRTLEHSDILRKKESEEKQLETNEQDAEQETEVTKVKHVPHRNTYAVCKEAGLDGLAKKFGLTAEQFGENLQDNYQRHEVDQYPIEPNDVASDFAFKTPEDCLKAAKFLVATQISREPAVRKCIRQTYFERAKLTVRPTKKGIKEIDENHPCFSFKYLKFKPVMDLRGDQFLKLYMAERDGFLITDIAIDKPNGNDGRPRYIDEIKICMSVMNLERMSKNGMY